MTQDIFQYILLSCLYLGRLGGPPGPAWGGPLPLLNGPDGCTCTDAGGGAACGGAGRGPAPR